MQKLNALGSAILLAGLGLASGCGGDDEGSPTAPGWSIPDDAVLGNLTDSQKETLCKETESNLMSSGTAEDAKEATCRVAGFLAALNALSMPSDAALQAACQPAYDQCAAMASMVTCTQPTATCMATMREYRACLDEVKTVSGTGLTLLPPCDELTLAKALAIAMAGTDAIPPTPACDTFNQKCPDFELPVSSPTPPM